MLRAGCSRRLPCKEFTCHACSNPAHHIEHCLDGTLWTVANLHRHPQTTYCLPTQRIAPLTPPNRLSCFGTTHTRYVCPDSVPTDLRSRTCIGYTNLIPSHPVNLTVCIPTVIHVSRQLNCMHTVVSHAHRIYTWTQAPRSRIHPAKERSSPRIQPRHPLARRQWKPDP